MKSITLEIMENNSQRKWNRHRTLRWVIANVQTRSLRLCILAQELSGGDVY